MTTSKERTIVNVVNPICCGLDVHKESITACILFADDQGKDHTIIREFTTFTDDLEQMRYWLLRHDCPIVAMESTGVYWHPVHNILEGYIDVILVNARDIKNVRGRLKSKTQELYRSIKGFFTENHRFLLQTLLSTVATLEGTIGSLDKRIKSLTVNHEELLERMKEVPGISDISARDIIAEVGTTLDAFPNYEMSLCYYKIWR